MSYGGAPAYVPVRRRVILPHKTGDVFLIQYEFVCIHILPFLPPDSLPERISHLITLKRNQADFADSFLLQGLHGSAHHTVSNAVLPVSRRHAHVIKTAGPAVMAAEELRDFIENGNITHSVNFGAVDLGPITAGERLAIIHQNVQGMIGKFSQYLADSGINIENMANKSRGTMAYTLIDIAGEVPTDVIDHLAQAEGVRRIRVIRA